MKQRGAKKRKASTKEKKNDSIPLGTHFSLARPAKGTIHPKLVKQMRTQFASGEAAAAKQVARIAEEDAQRDSQISADVKPKNKNCADPRLRDLYIANFEDSLKNNDRDKRVHAARNLIGLCAQGLGRPQRLDIWLERWLQQSLKTIAENGNFEPVEIADAFHLRKGKGNTVKELDTKIAIEVEVLKNVGEKHEYSTSAFISKGVGRKTVERIYTEHKYLAKALIAEQQVPSLSLRQQKKELRKFLKKDKAKNLQKITKASEYVSQKVKKRTP